jgi:hypothetical protein
MKFEILVSASITRYTVKSIGPFESKKIFAIFFTRVLTNNERDSSTTVSPLEICVGFLTSSYRFKVFEQLEDSIQQFEERFRR